MTRKRRTTSAKPVVIDACCLIDLLVSGQAEAILRATGYAWHLPSAVQAEVQYVRQHDPDNPGSYQNVPVDLRPFVGPGVLTPCQPDDPHEEARYVHYATLFRSDGEAMCLAMAECRGWTVATDDRKAILVAQRAGLTVVSCPELVKVWAESARLNLTDVAANVTNIRTLARFVPHSAMPEAKWWLGQVLIE